ncbi:hypothetical protein ACVWYN_002678 [Pedobacter sp. UYP24]
MASTANSKNFKMVNPGPLDAWMGPYESVDAANTAIPNVVIDVDGTPKNFREGKFAIVLIGAVRILHWWDQDYTNSGLKPIINGITAPTIVFSTYANMRAYNVVSPIIALVVVDEKRKRENSQYTLWSNTNRRWIATVEDDNTYIL